LLIVEAEQHDYFPSKFLQYYNPVTLDGELSELGPY